MQKQTNSKQYITKKLQNLANINFLRQSPITNKKNRFCNLHVIQATVYACLLRILTARCCNNFYVAVSYSL